ncbi:tyrosine-type recombinase/integrase [Winogradskyella immobilis]|uniref:Site-specific integrase n=1 Tax=Winogradskyella immobilis TaxID=2816852 RepID=A0ABS8ER78_9FLAO|nr:site-specific integrase [Winogradskyella immobilis]MCC1485362.1 site-specific integrase [Winogradskyella immobilis]MCG0017454.1 site-specific integrase [Winogradskyella immobilis]
MSKLPIVSLSVANHRNENQILIGFKHDWSLINVVKHIPEAKWSKTLKSWYVKNNSKNLKLIYSTFKDSAEIDNRLLFEKAVEKKDYFPVKRKRNINNIQRQFLNNFYTYLKGKRYSKSTVDTYSFFIADFIEYHNKIDLKNLSNRDVELFIESVFLKRNYSISTQRQFISAIKQFILFYPDTQISNLALTRPKRSKKLPIVLSPQEMIGIIQHTKNLKHRAILTLLYSSGLRIGELLTLKLSDFNVERKQIHIRSGKGRKDRFVSIADSFLPLLHNYILTYKPSVYFVEGPKRRPYSASSVRKFLSKSCKASGIKRNITPHTLRHSYATHLLEHGVGLRHIQELLGHSKPETTMIYTHVARKDLLDISSPLDLAIKQFSTNEKSEQKFLLSSK